MILTCCSCGKKFQAEDIEELYCNDCIDSKIESDTIESLELCYE